MKNYTHIFQKIGLLTAAAAGILGSNQAMAAVTDSVVTLDNIDITTSKTKKELSAANVTRQISTEDIDRLGITGISDAIRRMPGVLLRDYGGAGGLKTVSVRGLGSEHTGVAYDGVPLSDVQNGQIDLARYSTENIDNLSLSIGAADDIFTSARSIASASIINLSSWQQFAPDKPLQLTAIVKTGSFGYVSPSARFSTPLGRKSALMFNGDYTHADNRYPYTIRNGYTVEHSTRKNSEMDAGHCELNYQWVPRAGSRFLAKFYYYDAFQHLPGPAILYNDDSNQTLKEVNMFGQVHYRARLSSLFSLSSFAKFNWSKTRYHDVDGIYHDGFITNKYIQREAYATATLLCTPFKGFSASYALDYFFNDLHSNLKKYPNPHRNSLLQCLSAKYSVNCVTVVGNMLLSIFDDVPGDGSPSATRCRLSPAIGVSVQPLKSSNLFFRANYKNIYRMPSFNELYFDHYGTLNLEPEITDQFNAGITYGIKPLSWLPALDITLDGYYNIVSNKIVAIPYNMFVWTMSNMGKVQAYGIDLTLSSTFAVHARQNIILSGNYSWQKALGRTSPDKLDWNKQLPYTPVHSGAFSLTWENPYVSLVAKGFGCSERYATKENVASSHMPGYMDFGFAAYHTFRFKKCSIELRADLINAFNRQYEVVARYPMPGRAWLASLKFSL